MPSPSVIVDSPHFKLIEPQNPIFERVKVIPNGIEKQLERALCDFIESSHVPQGTDLTGFCQQTLQTMASATVFNQPGTDLWLGIHGKELWIYVLAYIGTDIDNRLTYHVHQAWVKKDQRGKAWVKDAWEKIRQRAQVTFCKHLVVISSRANNKAYCRFLGKGYHQYVSLLKEDF